VAPSAVPGRDGRAAVLEDACDSTSHLKANDSAPGLKHAMHAEDDGRVLLQNTRSAALPCDRVHRLGSLPSAASERASGLAIHGSCGVRLSCDFGPQAFAQVRGQGGRPSPCLWRRTRASSEQQPGCCCCCCCERGARGSQAAEPGFESVERQGRWRWRWRCRGPSSCRWGSVVQIEDDHNCEMEIEASECAAAGEPGSRAAVLNKSALAFGKLFGRAPAHRAVPASPPATHVFGRCPRRN